jgi:hypothetical protein
MLRQVRAITYFTKQYFLLITRYWLQNDPCVYASSVHHVVGHDYRASTRDGTHAVRTACSVVKVELGANPFCTIQKHMNTNVMKGTRR